MNQSMQYVTPYPYARLVPGQPLTEQVAEPWKALKITKRALVDKHANDHEMSRMRDFYRLATGAGIAVLATACAAATGLGEFLGLATWFPAMAVIPKIVNFAVYLKTGVNLDHDYINSDGQRKALFTDTNYLPLHLLPDSEIDRAADRLGIPQGIDRRRDTEARIQEIAIQAKTWWMLVAGPATPALSGFLCDRLEQPVAYGLNRVRTAYLKWRIATAPTPDLLNLNLERYVDEILGDKHNSRLALWWRDFGHSMVDKLGLKRIFETREALSEPHEAMFDRIVEHLSSLSGKSEYHHTLRDMVTRLEGEKQHIRNLEQIATNLVQSKTDILGPRTQAIKARVQPRFLTAESTLDHYIALLKAMAEESPLSKERVRELMEAPNAADIQAKLADGLYISAEKAAGGAAQSAGKENQRFSLVRENIRTWRYGAASDTMGASPRHHLLQSLKSALLRRRWRTRVTLYLGGGLVAATLLYNQFVIGRQPKRTATQDAATSTPQPNPAPKPAFTGQPQTDRRWFA